MENENITKSIIYGNTYENRYGRFLPVCSSISDRTSITSILDYLKESPHFKKFNRVAYAYRVDEMPVVFITEKKNIQTQYFEGCYSDQMIEGSGEKLLHLLQKFNIRNVVIAVIIQQFNPLLPFQCVNYRAIVENSRLLLDQLYKKVINYHSQSVDKKTNDLLLSDQKTVKIKKVDIASQTILPETAKVGRPKERPNHISSISGPQNQKSATFLTKKSSSSRIKKQNDQKTDYYSQQLAFLWARVKSMREQYEKIMESITPKEIDQIKYFILYDKNPLICLVLQLFMIYLGIEDKQQLIEGTYLNDFSQVKQLKPLPKDILKKLDQIIKTNKKLTIDAVIKTNRSLGLIFSIIELQTKYTKSLERITQILEKQKMKISRNQIPLNKNKLNSYGNHGFSSDSNLKGTKAVMIDQTQI